MTAITQQKEMVETLATKAVAASQPAIESKPVVGGQITIKLALTPGMITMLAVPATVGVTVLVAWLLLTSLAMPVYPREMIAAGIVNTIGGMVAALPLFLLMKRGAAAIAQAAILGIFVRIGSVLMLMVLVGAGGWGLERITLAYWVMACYFPLWMVETAMVAWLSHKAKC